MSYIFTLGEYIEQELRPALEGVSENFDFDAMADWMVETGRIEWLGDFDHAMADWMVETGRIEAPHGQTDEEFWAKVAELDGGGRMSTGVVTEPKRGPGQPRIGSERKITIPDGAWATLAAIAAEQKTSASALVREAIDDYIYRKGAE